MADPPRNLDFATPAGPGAPDGWVLSDAPTVREFAGFAANAFTPPEDPNGTGWSAFGGALSTVDPPYDPTAAAVLGSATRFTEDLAFGGHGLAHPVTRTLEEGKSYAFGACLRSGDAVYAGPVVEICGTCVLAAVYSFTDGAATLVGWPTTPPDPLIVDGVSATVSAVAGPNGWVRVGVSFKLADDAASRGLLASSNFGVFVFGDAAGALDYAGAGNAVDVWGAFAYESSLSVVETYSAGWGTDVYASSLDLPALATFPSALPQGTTYEGYDRWAVPYLADLEGYLADASFAGAGVVEAYSVGWGTDSYADENSGVVYATFGGGAETETYAVGWGTDGYIDAVPAPVGAAFSDDLALGAETYAPAYPEVAFDAVVATDRFNATAHGLTDGVRGRVAVFGYAAGAQLPTPLSAHVRYYVVGALADSFQLSLTAGGAAIDITDAGVGECYFVPDPARYWTSE